MRYFNAGSLLFVLLTEKAQVLADAHVTTSSSEMGGAISAAVNGVCRSLVQSLSLEWQLCLLLNWCIFITHSAVLSRDNLFQVHNVFSHIHSRILKFPPVPPSSLPLLPSPVFILLLCCKAISLNISTRERKHVMFASWYLAPSPLYCDLHLHNLSGEWHNFTVWKRVWGIGISFRSSACGGLASMALLRMLAFLQCVFTFFQISRLYLCGFNCGSSTVPH